MLETQSKNSGLCLPKTRLYFHIPFCSNICPYCDFKKTALFDSTTLDLYLKTLSSHFKWFTLQDYHSFSSLYLGGGTPSLITDKYQPLFETVLPYLQPNSEITLESNPIDLTESNLRIWKDLGINRLSIGVQSFDKKAQAFLSRDSFEQSDLLERIDLARTFFSNINIDLIYALPIPGSSKIFFKDLDILSKILPEHISLYCLTYSPSTPLGLRLARNLISKINDTTCFNLYQKASTILKDLGYTHEEVSNWYKDSFPAKHSNLYWSNGYYLGVGLGASGYLPITPKLQSSIDLKSPKDLGIRYSFEGSIGSFIDSLADPVSVFKQDPRDNQAFLYEYLGSCLRSINGIDLTLIKELLGYSFHPTPLISYAIDHKMILIKDNYLFLDPGQWFLETSWELKLIDAFCKK